MDLRNERYMVNKLEKKLLQIMGVEKIYKSGEVDKKALDNISVEIDKGKFIAIVGKSGSGKSTLLNIMAGIDRPTKGDVYYDGKNISAYSENQLTRWRCDKVGIVFQFFQLIPTLNVIENVMLPMDFAGKMNRREKRERASLLLKKANIEDLELKFPNEISGGEQQRVAIVRALANNPDIIFADEPTGNLDSETTKKIMELFDTLLAENKTIIMVTHNEDLAKTADGVIAIKDGKIERVG